MPRCLAARPDGHPCRLPTGERVFTDGSKRADGAIGSGVFTELDGGKEWAIKPSGHDLSLHTVPYAELVGALSGLRYHPARKSLELFVDSSTIMYLANMSICAPERLRYRKHKGILTHIMAEVCWRVVMHGCTVTLRKVRSHIGVKGNTSADRLAAAAAAAAEGDAAEEMAAGPEVEEFSDVLAGSPGLGASWPLYQQRPMTVGEEDAPYWRADTFDAPIKKQAARVHQNGVLAATNSTHLRLLLDLHLSAAPGAPRVQPESVLAMWGFPFHLRRLALLLRFGQFNFLKQLHRNDPRRYPSSGCELCNAGVECQAHALGGCRHPRTHSMICRRHGEGPHLIREAVELALHCPVAAAAEGHGPFEQPPWLLPAGVVRASTPDVLVVPTLHAAGPAPADRSEHSVHMIEWYSTYDTNLLAKWADKRSQHSRLQAQLLDNGWQSVQSEALGVTHSGLLTGNFLAAMQHIGLGGAPAKQLVKDVALRSVQWCSNIISMRRGVRRGSEPAADRADPRCLAHCRLNRCRAAWWPSPLDDAIGACATAPHAVEEWRLMTRQTERRRRSGSDTRRHMRQ